MRDVLVIGGGASGILAALTAAESPENRVLLLERQQRIGRKLLATGNGRCNLTNTGAAPEHYHGEEPDFVRPALEAFPPAAALDWFHKLGLLTAEEYGGRVYPLSNSANSVLDVLRFALDRAGVEQRCACPVRAVRREKRGFAVETDGACLRADKLILACGGAAGAKLGGVLDGYQLAKSLGHKRTGLYPALVQLVTEPEYPRALKGVRAEAELTLLRRTLVLARSKGELQFTDKGVSGPVSFDVSRAAATGGEGLTLRINFLPCGVREAEALLAERQAAFPELPASEVFTGMLHNRLGRMLVKYSGVDAARPLRELDRQALARLAEAASAFTLPVKGTEGFDNAQVTAGGLRTADFDPHTLESRLVPGLFACGELLDVDGDCGGYNLQWAWASGRLAGRLGA
jgi:predicted Rossmann fold flavoprotein